MDVIDMNADYSKYRLVIAPMLYMVRPGVGEAIEKFVKAGGTFVATYWSGIVNENDLCFLGGFPGPLRKTLGIWSEEIDGLYDHDGNGLVLQPQNELGLSGTYPVYELCDLIHTETAEALAVYTDDFYAGRPALTVNHFGKGKAYYIAARTKEPFYRDFYSTVIQSSGIKRSLEAVLPDGVTVQVRTDGEHDYVFLLNFSGKEQTVMLDHKEYTDLLAAKQAEAVIRLPASGGVRILKRRASVE